MQTLRLDRSRVLFTHKRRVNIHTWPLFYQMLVPSGLLLMVLIVALLTTAYALQRLQTSSAALKRSYETMQQAVEIEKSVVDMETGVRGFALTNNESFLEPYKNATELARLAACGNKRTD